MRFEVPQFIEVEDKIFGPLTWKQFVYLAGGAGGSIMAWFLVPTFIFKALAILLIAALSIFLAFQRVNNQPFSIFLESILTYLSNNKLYLWRKHEQQAIIMESSVAAPATPSRHTLPTQGGNIGSLSRKLELETLNSNQEVTEKT